MEKENDSVVVGSADYESRKRKENRNETREFEWSHREEIPIVEWTENK